MASKSTSENPAERGDDAPAQTVRPQHADDASHVEYVGGAHVREISAADWKSVGADGQGKVSWDRRNQRTNRVALSDLSPEAVAYLKTDSGFRFVKAD